MDPLYLGIKDIVVKNSEAVGLLLVNFSRSGQVHCEVALASWQRCLAKSKQHRTDGCGSVRCFFWARKKTMSRSMVHEIGEFMRKSMF